MGAAAYRRGSRAISRQIDRELAERRQICGGTYRPGPNKDYSRCDRCGRVDYEKYEGDKCTMPPKGAWPRDNPVTEGGVVLAALAAAGLAWLLLRPKKAAAATVTPVELPSFTPSSTPAPQPVSAAPKLPELNCAGKVRVTYKFKDSPLLLNVFRRLTIWKTDKSPQEPSFQEEDRIWAPTTAADLFKIGAQDAQGWVNSTKLENDVKDQQVSPLPGERYLAEAWVETTDGWCLAATSTNYEAWVK